MNSFLHFPPSCCRHISGSMRLPTTDIALVLGLIFVPQEKLTPKSDLDNLELNRILTTSQFFKFILKLQIYSLRSLPEVLGDNALDKSESSQSNNRFIKRFFGIFYF